jgi:transmembrane sensor
MLELEQLIRKFWANETTLAENQRLLQLLEQYRATVKGSMQENFQENETEREHGLQPDKALSILQKIHGNLGMEQHPAAGQKTGTAILRKLYRRIAVAASIGIVAVSSFLLAGGHHKKSPTVQTATVTAAAPAKPRLMRLANGPDSVLSVTLKDGSTVQLGKNSSLSWYEPFINNRRDLSLTGIALFKVAKDKTRPFTVYAGGIATTALGTRFWVNATDAAKIRVRLLEGKVMVNAATGSGMTMKDVYLAPGQEFSFDKNSQEYAVNASDTRSDNDGKATPRTDQPELIFKKEPLGQVFRKVASLYNVSLSFRKEELNGLYFTGTFLKSDSLNIVLSTICNVNDLLVTKKEDSIIITRSH